MIFTFLRLNQKLFLGFGVIVILLAGVLGYTYIHYDRQVQAVEDNFHTYEVIRESDGLMESLLNMETGARGYALAGKEEFLEPYNNGRADFDQHYGRLLELTIKYPSQQKRLRSLYEGFQSWNDWEKNYVIDSRHKVAAGLMDMDDVIAIVQTDKGKDEMDRLRSILSEISQTAGRVLQTRDAQLKETEHRTGLVMTMGGLLAVILAVCISIITSISISKPRKTLVAAIERITEQNYQEPIRMRTDKDLAVVISHFNSMQAAIQQREQELKRKNEALKEQMAEVNEANKLKSQFLATMSHELRTPLNSIIGFTNRVIKKSGDILPPVQKENLLIVHEEAQHLLDLINSLLDYSKMEAGKMEVHLEAFNLLKVIEEVQSMTRTLMEGKDLAYRLTAFDDSQIPIVSDRMKTKQILINLISNAFKYSNRGTVAVSVEQESDFYVISVQDDGIGIAPENLENIFDEFRQVDGTYTRKVGGTGLGLSITKKFVEMLGGSIEVSSTPDIGSRFTVKLPVQSLQDKGREPDSGTGKEAGVSAKKRIVCVDDDINVQKLYKQVLEDNGFETSALDGRGDVVSEIIRLSPDIVLLDIMLPQKDGWEILSEIKNDDRTRKIPVIMASVLSESNLAFRMKADEYLIKPMGQDELLDAIARTISKVNGIDVLVADDDENFLHLISQFLREESISYRLARDGQEAVLQMSMKKPDVVILDIMMPKLDGFAVIEEIRSRESMKDTPVIVVTSKDLTNAEKEMLHNRSHMIIQKSGTLIDHVMEVLVKRIKERAHEEKHTDC